MNWKKLVVALGVSFVVLSAVVMLAVGVAVTAGVAVAGQAISTLGDDIQVDVAENGRLAFSDANGARFSFNAEERELVVTDADGDQVRLLAPRAFTGREFGSQVERLDRFDFNGSVPVYLWPAMLLAPLVMLGKGLTLLASLGLILVGVWLVLRYRRQPDEKEPKAAEA